MGEGLGSKEARREGGREGGREGVREGGEREDVQLQLVMCVKLPFC